MAESGGAKRRLAVGIHVLFHLSEQSAVKLHDVGTVAAPHDHVQVHEQLLLLLLIHRRPNPLKRPQPVGSEGQITGSSLPPRHQSRHLDRHDLVTRLVHHLVDGAVSPSADLPQVFEILGCEVPVLLRGDLQLPGRLDAVSPQPLSDRKTANIFRTFGFLWVTSPPTSNSQQKPEDKTKL